MKYRLLRAIVLLFCLICTVEGWAQIETYSSFIVDDIGYMIQPYRDREVAVVRSVQEYDVIGIVTKSSVREIATSGYRKLDYSGDVTIPTTVTHDGTTYTVTEIAQDCFKDCYDLISVKLPDLLDTIGQDAFRNCVKLKHLSIPQATKCIGANAFTGCSGLTSLRFEDGSAELYLAKTGSSTYHTFADCPIDTLYLGRNVIYLSNNSSHFCKTKNVVIGDAVTSLYEKVFQNSDSLKTVVLGKNVAKIGTYAFEGCKALKTVDARSEKLKVIPDYTFRNCTSLKAIELPAQLDSIGQRAFSDCKQLEKLTIPGTTRYIGGNAFVGCSGLTSLCFEDGTTELNLDGSSGNRNRTFADSPIDTLYLGRNVKYLNITNSHFAMTKNVVISDAVASLCKNVFQNCESLKTVVFGKNVAEIGTYAFDGCKALETVDARSEKLKVIPDYTFRNCTSLKAIELPAKLDSIGQRAFSDCKQLEKVTIPGTTRYIGGNAFVGCSGLTSLCFEDGTTELNLDGSSGNRNRTFADSPIDTLYLGRNVKYLNITNSHFAMTKNVVISDAVASLCKNVFQNCESLKTVVFGKNVAEIGTYAFNGCKALETVDARSEKLKVIPDYTFSNCTSLKAIELPAQLDTIGQSAFASCSQLEKVSIPGTTRYIGESAFKGCSGLTSLRFEDGTAELHLAGLSGNVNKTFSQSPIDTLYLGRNIIYLSQNTDSHFAMTKNVVISDAVASLCKNVFQNCESLKTVVFGKNVAEIGTYAFDGCKALETVDARSEKLKVIPDYTFRNCTSLKAIELPAQLDSIGQRAFSDCKQLEKVTIPGTTRYIGENAFSYCSGLTSLCFEDGTAELHLAGSSGNVNKTFSQSPIDTLYLGRNIIYLSQGTDSHFTMTKNVVISDAVTSLCDNEFMGCSKLEQIFAPWRTPFEINSNVFSNDTYKTATLVIPKGTMNAYQNTEAWKRFLNIEEEVGTQVEQTLELAELPAMTYGDAAYTLPEETTEGQELTWASSNTAVATVTGHQIEIKKAGTAIITATQEGNDDYLPFSREFTLTIAKAALKITADNQTREQGQDNPTLTVKYEGFKYSDNASSLTTQPTVSTTATKDSPIGSYPITASGANSDNYTISYVNGTLTITEATQPQDVTDISQLADAIYIEPLTALIGSDQDIEVRMKNAEKATSYGFTLVLPEGMTISTSGDGSFDEAVTLSSRNSNHGVTTNKLADNTYKIGVASLSSKSLTGNDGLVLTIKAHVQESMAAGTYPILVKSPLIVYSDGTKPSMQETRTLVTVEDYQKGDVDGDGVVDLADAVQIINHYVGKPSVVFIEKVADVDGDGVIDLADAVRIINFYVGRIPSLSRDNAGEHDPQ